MTNINTAIQLSQRIRGAGAIAYVVGGYVRDQILGRDLTNKDIDLVVVGLKSQQELLDIFPTGKPVGKSFPVVVVNGIEVALARTERKIGLGHTAFDCNVSGVTLEQDLSRRDLTINAIALDLLQNKYFDPYNGRKDCLEHNLRPVTDAFKEDPLRVFRAARFSATLGFRTTPALRSMCYELKDEVATLSAERVWNETELALNSNIPREYFYSLLEFGAINYWFKELSDLGNIPAGPTTHHQEGNAFTHTMMVLMQCKSPVARWAAVCHDLGKAVTDPAQWPSHHNHEELGVPLVQSLNSRLKTPNLFKDVALICCDEHLNGHRFLELRDARKHDLLFKIGRHLPYFEELCQADALGRTPPKDGPHYKTMDSLYSDLLKIKAEPEWGTGKIVGERLRQKRISYIKKNYR